MVESASPCAASFGRWAKEMPGVTLRPGFSCLFMFKTYVVALVHNRFRSVGGPHPTRLTPGHLPPRGRLCVVLFIIRKYNITSLYGVARAFPEGEGGREADE